MPYLVFHVLYRPEVDTAVHCLHVLDIACSLTDDIDVRFAALLRVGKAKSDSENLPHHHGRKPAVRSLKLAKRLKLGNKTKNSL